MSLVVKISTDSPMSDRGLSIPIVCDKSTIEGSSVTQQQYSKDADINNIMARYRKTGVLINPLDPDSNRVPLFMDVSGIGDFQAVQTRLNSINEAFMTLSPDVRAKFDNTPAKAIDFMTDPKNLKESVDLGLLPKELLPKEIPVSVEEAAAAAAAGQAKGASA